MAVEATTGPLLVVHGHFYQPPRENPWTEELAREAGAEPFHDWNDKIAAESYRPNAHARIVDEHGRVVSIVNNYEHLSFDVGPTLMTWLVEHDPDVASRMAAADAATGGAVAQAFFHVILPLADERDIRTQVRWGLLEFQHRYGRRAEGLWLPETAVDDRVLAVLAEEGVRFTLLAPNQAEAVRPLEGGEWHDVSDGSIDTTTTYRWVHPDDASLGVDLVFYDGGLSHAIAFELGSLTSEALLDRVVGNGQGLVTLAADGETFGHHHRWGDRLVAYALAVEAPRRGIRVVNAAEALRAIPPTHEVRVRLSAWSCAHGVGRWQDDCGCSTGGEPGWDQRWRRPLRDALDLLRRACTEVFERRGPAVLRDPWLARDEYASVLLGGAVARAGFIDRHVTGDVVEAFTLLEAERHAMAMYTSCGWFFNDLAGLETVQVLRYAARAADCLAELGEKPPMDEFLAILDTACSNVADEGTGRDLWERRVEPSRVGPDRVVAHLALLELLEARAVLGRVAQWDVDVQDHGHRDRGALSLCSGRVALTHRRTGRRTEHVYAALHLGGLEVLGVTRGADADRDDAELADLRAAFDDGATVTTLLRLLADGMGAGGREFGLDWALPDAAEQILASAAQSLADRFAAAYDRLFADHRDTLVGLAAAGYPLPQELRAPAELALARRLEAEFAAQQGSLDPTAYAGAIVIAREARANGFHIDTPQARRALERLLLKAVQEGAIDAARTLLRIAGDLDLRPSLDRAQELVYEALVRDGRDPQLRALGDALGLAVKRIVAS